MDYELTEHARESVRKRSIQLAWLDRAIFQPQWVEADRTDLTLEHRLIRIDEYGGRVLRVILNTVRTPPRIVTVFFDRSMRNRKYESAH